MAEEIAAEERGLPEAFARVLGDYERHLAAERDLTVHTVRAYVGDVAGLLEHARRLGHDDASALDLRTLRSWLAKQQTMGKSRTTLARRATAARVFTAWLARTGRVAVDPGASLASPKAHRSLPPVLRSDEARDLIRAAAELADDGSPASACSAPCSVMAASLGASPPGFGDHGRAASASRQPAPALTTNPWVAR